jgi:cytosine deaminase
MSGYNDVDRLGMQIALAEALKGYEAGGIPIGSAILLCNNDNMDCQEFKMLGSGHNQRVKKSSPTLHGEMSALEAAGRLKPEIYRNSIIVSPFATWVA